MVAVTLNGICKNFGEHSVLKDISLSVPDKAFVAFVGPSGCGKSTLLRVIAGLEAVSAGELRFGDKLMNDVPAPDRGAAMVFQSYALYPHMTVWENMSFSLRLKGFDRNKRRKAAAKVAETLQLKPYLDRRPGQLSGGQRQRVAIGRALMRQPEVFLFDEPLSNLDAALRAEMRVELSSLHQAIGSTMIYVTHDQVEAMTMADKIVVINEGQVIQIGSPMELYDIPNSRFVAEFIGAPKINIFNGIIGEIMPDQTVVKLTNEMTLALPVHEVEQNTKVTVGVRPEHLSINDDGDRKGYGLKFSATVDLVEHLGAEALIYCSIPGHSDPIRVTTKGGTKVTPRQTIDLMVDTARCHLFGPSGQRIGQRTN